jgi:type III pantothenate kinase
MVKFGKEVSPLLLTVDVGNTSTGVAVFRDDKIVFRNRMPTPVSFRPQTLQALVRPALARNIDSAIVSSVVPPVDSSLARCIRRLWNVRPLVLDHRTDTGIALRIDRPAELGADRIADAAGALRFFAPPLMVIDSGTATTFDLINRKREYIGGCIFPGIEIAVRSLAENAARLKQIRFAVPASVLGSNTVDCIRAGIYFGTVGALSHLIGAYKKILGRNARVIATGGLIRFFRGKVPGIDLFEPDLIFYGLKAIHDRHDRG